MQFPYLKFTQISNLQKETHGIKITLELIIKIERLQHNQQSQQIHQGIISNFILKQYFRSDLASSHT
ncbi:unnamed protein product [Paramecium octaurelia]|uniref:Uncharacterized protein n=1 Tax=Paramecium octaurelia TaxID=43137 RepID=A0A8S1Y6L6_PAROT|nr:unnamed protein product [Paramecium octaurelia]